MFWKKKYEKAVAERDAMRQQLEQSRREITEHITRVEYYDALFKCASDMCEKWHALYDERFDEMKKLRAELEGLKNGFAISSSEQSRCDSCEWKGYVEPCRGDARIRELEAENELLRAEITSNERKEA